MPSRIVLNLSEETLSAVDQSLQLDAKVYDADGAAILGAQVAWTSSRTDVATVSANGLVIAVSNGTTTGDGFLGGRFCARYDPRGHREYGATSAAGAAASVVRPRCADRILLRYRRAVLDEQHQLVE